MFIVFDGLDELLDTHYRKEIRADVESFARRYPNVPILVTSREVGYEQAPLHEALFLVARLADFDVSRVRDYAQKWFALEESLSERERTEKADSFVRESNAVADLRSNPLMLALMCNFYKGQNYIPRNRPDVYDKCARMLFDTWDRQRDIKADLPIEEHIEPAMQFLARWIYEDERRQGGVTESELVDQAAAFLSEHRFDDPHKAAHAARAFIEFCRGRAWVFTDTGSTEGGEPLYQFTHRTFLEYFTARYLVATNPTALGLARLLLPHVESSEWDVIAQLAFHIKARATIGDADELLTLALDRAGDIGSATKRAALLGFGGRCLQFLVPKPATVRRLVSDTVASLLDSASNRSNRYKVELTDSLTTALGSLMAARAENREAVTDSLMSTSKGSM
jgi:predicted NACHT family NTPase